MRCRLWTLRTRPAGLGHFTPTRWFFNVLIMLHIRVSQGTSRHGESIGTIHFTVCPRSDPFLFKRNWVPKFHMVKRGKRRWMLLDVKTWFYVIWHAQYNGSDQFDAHLIVIVLPSSDACMCKWNQTKKGVMRGTTSSTHIPFDSSQHACFFDIIICSTCMDKNPPLYRSKVSQLKTGQKRTWVGGVCKSMVPLDSPHRVLSNGIQMCNCFAGTWMDSTVVQPSPVQAGGTQSGTHTS